MNRTAVAKQLLALARELVAIDFPTKDAMDIYLDAHPGADKSNHRVVENPDNKKTEQPSGHKGRPGPNLTKLMNLPPDTRTRYVPSDPRDGKTPGA